MRYRLIFLVIFSFYVNNLCAQNTPKLAKTKINDKITLGVPKDFTPMPQEAYKKKYGSNRQPIAIYTSPDGKADLGINQMKNRLSSSQTKADWKEEDLKILHGMYKNSILAMHYKVDFVQDTILLINKRKFIVLEFVGTIQDLDKDKNPVGNAVQQYSYLQYLIEDNKVVIFNFTCPNRLRQMHENTASAVMKSIKIK